MDLRTRSWSFDTGYASPYTNAVPILNRLGRVGVENLQLNGVPPSEGRLTDAQVRGLIAAGWELDSEGAGQSDLTTVDPTQINEQVASARQTLHSRYNVPVNWFCYPSGRYDATVIAAVRAAGFTGATTTNPGSATRRGDRFRLPRLRVLAGTSPSQLLAQIDSAPRTTAAAPTNSGT